MSSEQYLHSALGAVFSDPTLPGEYGEIPSILGHTEIYPESPIPTEELDVLKAIFAAELRSVAPDLGSKGLAEHHATTLFDALAARGAGYDQILLAGAQMFYEVGKNVLGPLAVGFVHHVLSEVPSGTVIFPARDATPFYWAAKVLTTINPDAYAVSVDQLQNPVFNRRLWGIDDEQDGSSVLSVADPMVQKLLGQMGFGSGKPVTFVEVGSWGTMVDQLNQAMQSGAMPVEAFQVYFLFSHLPDRIYGYLNEHGSEVPEAVLETIADTWEAFPKIFTRPTKLIEVDGIVKAAVDGKLLDSQWLPHWTTAALQGVVDAAVEFCAKGQVIVPEEEIAKLRYLSELAKAGQFTGVLPDHSETWSQGETWKNNWPWGQLLPLQ